MNRQMLSYNQHSKVTPLSYSHFSQEPTLELSQLMAKYISNPKNIEAHLGLMEIYEELGYEGRARYHFFHAKEIDPYHPRLLGMQIEDQAFGSDAGKLKALIKKVLAFPHNLTVQFKDSLLTKLYKRKAYDVTLMALKLIHKDQSTLPSSLSLLRVRCLIGLKEYDRATAILYRMLSEGENEPEVSSLLSKINQLY